MNIKPYTTAGFLVLVLFVVNACGVDLEEKKSADAKTTINEFSITGGAGLVGDALQIAVTLNMDTNVPETLFDLNWDVDSSDPYTIYARLSSDSAPTVNDQLFLQLECGSDTTLYGCDEIGSIKCNIRNRNMGGVIDGNLYLRCGNGQNLVEEDPSDITSFIPGYPQTLYVLFEACNAALAEKRDCKSAGAVEVTILSEFLP